MSLFFYDLFLIRKPFTLFFIVKLLFVPIWLGYRVITLKNKKLVLLLRSDIFGNQLMEFQQLNQMAKISQQVIFFNHHPIVAGEFIFKKQMNQIFLHQNIKKLNHLFIILRMYSQSIENSIYSRIRLKRKIFLTSFREQGFAGSLLNHFMLDAFPKFSNDDWISYKKSIALSIPEIDLNKRLIAVHSRSGNFPKSKEPERVFSVFRNTSFSEIDFISSEFNTQNFTFIRIGHFEDYERTKSSNIIDVRRVIRDTDDLQLSVFALINGYVGSSSGPLGFFAIQKKPCLLISVYPIDLEYSFNPRDSIVIPKLIFNLKDNRFFGLEEQFDIDFVKLQNLYNDRLIIEKQLEPRSLPVALTKQIYSNWQSSILNNDFNSQWIKDSIIATNSLRKLTKLQNLPLIPVEYFNYLSTQNY
jgi:putative glycosyltransferase (TIGR04372 family)